LFTSADERHLIKMIRRKRTIANVICLTRDEIRILQGCHFSLPCRYTVLFRYFSIVTRSSAV